MFKTITSHELLFHNGIRCTVIRDRVMVTTNLNLRTFSIGFFNRVRPSLVSPLEQTTMTSTCSIK